MKKSIFIFISFNILLFPQFANAAEQADSLDSFSLVFLFIVLLLLAGRIGALIERLHQPAVLGELLMGMFLAAVALFPKFHGIVDLSHNALVVGIAEIGILLLLFRIGLESNLSEMKYVGLKAFFVAAVGVTLPFIGGYFATKLLIPSATNNVCLFLGATLTATSVGITTRVFQDLHVLKTIESKIVLGAAVIDDILGLLILAIVSGIIATGHIDPKNIVLLCVKAFAFLAGAIFIGRLIAPFLGKWAASVNSGIGMKTTLALVFCGIFAYTAFTLAGLAPIVGAFAAGLILDPIYFKAFAKPQLAQRLHIWADRLRRTGKNSDLANEIETAAYQKEQKHVASLVENISYFFVPLFFVYTGLQVDFSVFNDLKTLGIALVITAVAIIGKLACGYVTGKAVNHKLVGFGMVPRGEVGLIFLNIGKKLGVVNNQIFAVGVIMVILTTLFTPSVLGIIVKNQKKT